MRHGLAARLIRAAADHALIAAFVIQLLDFEPGKFERTANAWLNILPLPVLSWLVRRASAPSTSVLAVSRAAF
jgi:hypothetical protein